MNDNLYEHFFGFPGFLVLIALIFQSLGFLARDELFLRVLVLIGTCFYLLFYYCQDDEPIVAALFASGVLGVVNLGMIIYLIFERTTFTMSDEMSRIYRSFPTLNPGQFRKIMKMGNLRDAQPDTVLTTDGTPPRNLVLLFKGSVEITKGTSEYTSRASIFIGEVSFLRGGDASATVTIIEPSRYVEWDYEDLRKLMRNSAPMNNALIALFGNELAGRVANSMPVESDSATSS